MRRTIALAAISAAVLAVGVGLIYLPAGVITAGLAGLAAAYAIAYISARGRSRP